MRMFQLSTCRHWLSKSQLLNSPRFAVHKIVGHTRCTLWRLVSVLRVPTQELRSLLLPEHLTAVSRELRLFTSLPRWGALKLWRHC